eukprot:scaffold110063_cov17-Prasinocladus_malaysianus.AAC.1
MGDMEAGGLQAPTMPASQRCIILEQIHISIITKIADSKVKKNPSWAKVACLNIPTTATERATVTNNPTTSSPASSRQLGLSVSINTIKIAVHTLDCPYNQERIALATIRRSVCASFVADKSGCYGVVAIALGRKNERDLTPPIKMLGTLTIRNGDNPCTRTCKQPYRYVSRPDRHASTQPTMLGGLATIAILTSLVKFTPPFSMAWYGRFVRYHNFIGGKYSPPRVMCPIVRLLLRLYACTRTVLVWFVPWGEHSAGFCFSPIRSTVPYVSYEYEYE